MHWKAFLQVLVVAVPALALIALAASRELMRVRRADLLHKLGLGEAPRPPDV